MGTLAAFFNRSNDFIPTAVEPAVQGQQVRRQQAAAVRDAYQLRALPNDDVYFYCKRIDNSRLVRQADPAAKGQCWSAIGATCAVAAILGGMMAPKAATVLAGYKVQQLKQERAGLIEERKALDVEEARVPKSREYGRSGNTSGALQPRVRKQIVHLQPRGDSAVASVITPNNLVTR